MSFFKPHELQTLTRTQKRLPECGKCGLYKQCNSPKMKPTGSGERKILFVAEAPGAVEDERGVQLVGKSGQEVRRILSRFDLDIDDCTKTNAAICRPPGNKLQDIHIECCRPNLLKTIQQTQPHVMVLLGGAAVRSLIPTEREGKIGKAGRWVGWTIPSNEYGAWICPTFHPAFVLRQKDPVVDMLFRRHLKRAIRLEHRELPRYDLTELRSKVECIKRPKTARNRLKDLLQRPGGRLAFDYESNRLKPDHSRSRIYAVSFCYEGEDTFSFVLDESHHRWMKKILTAEKFLKIASNQKNEDRWSYRIFGVWPTSWWWDTMLASHYLDNRGEISSLKFQVFVRFGIAEYNGVVSHYFEQQDEEGFNRIEDCPIDDLLVYNGLDSLLEDMLALVQRKEMRLS